MDLTPAPKPPTGEAGSPRRSRITTGSVSKRPLSAAGPSSTSLRARKAAFENKSSKPDTRRSTTTKVLGVGTNAVGSSASSLNEEHSLASATKVISLAGFASTATTTSTSVLLQQTSSIATTRRSPPSLKEIMESESAALSAGTTVGSVSGPTKQQKPKGSKRIGFGQRYAQKEREKLIADRAKARYVKLMALHRDEGAVNLLIDWWRKYMPIKHARRELAHRKALKMVLDYYLLRWVGRFRRSKAKQKALEEFERQYGESRFRASILIQSIWRKHQSRKLLKFLTSVEMGCAQEIREREHFLRSITIVQSLWRRHRVRQIYRLRLAVMKRRRECIIVSTIRTHFAHKASRIKMLEIWQREQWAATTISRAYRSHVIRSLEKQLQFRKEHNLIPLNTPLLGISHIVQ